jgi:hypothetical protein
MLMRIRKKLPMAAGLLVLVAAVVIGVMRARTGTKVTVTEDRTQGD